MINFLEDNNGNRSSIRLMSLLSLITAITLAIVGTITGVYSETVINSFLAAAFAPKVVQKFAETRTNGEKDGE